MNAKRLFVIASGGGRGGRTNATLKTLEISNDDPKLKTLAEAIESFELSADGKKLLIRKDDDFYLEDADTPAPAKLEKRVPLGHWTFPLQPRQEWRQMFTEAWRLERDFFYDRNMNGVDWPAMLKKNLPLVARVTDRAELNDLLAEMVGELSALHTFVRGGDYRRDAGQSGRRRLGRATGPRCGGRRLSGGPHLPIRPGLPGIRLALDAPRRGHPPGRHSGNDQRQADALANRPWGIAARPGAPPGFAARQDPRRLFPRGGRGADHFRTGGRPSLRRLGIHAASPNRGAGPGRHRLCASAGHGPERTLPSGRAISTRFSSAKGFIVDARHNRGGSIDSWILEKLMRKAWFYRQGRVGAPTWNMQYAFRGHLVVLCDDHTASDGEAFAEGFRRLGLGKVIGTRTWGGEIWLSFDNVLEDKGIATAAEEGVYGPEGKWLIEGHGVEPDIIVDNLPHGTFLGGDAQLRQAIEVLRQEIKQSPVEAPPPPPYPDKSLK